MLQFKTCLVTSHDCAYSHFGSPTVPAGPPGYAPFFNYSSHWLASPPLRDLGMNAPMRSLTVSPRASPAHPLPPQHPRSRPLSECVAHLYICLDVRCGGHSCLSERTVDVSSVLYTIWAMMLTNCCVLFTGYAWSHVMCSAGAISALLFPLVCALCLHLECHFFLCSYVETACTLFAFFFMWVSFF